MNRILSRTLVGVGLLGFLVLSAAAQEPSAERAESQFERAFYLEVHQNDLAGAAAVYEKVAANSTAPEKLRAEAKTRLAGIREDLASAELARLMPPEVIAYAHLAEPGEHVERLLKLMGLVGPVPEGAADVKPFKLGGGLVLPADFTISPALVDELKKLRGAAIGLTGIDKGGRPSGLVAVHPGNCNLLRGLIETAVQLLEPGEPIDGFKTYRVPDLGWVMITNRLALAADSRAELAAAAERLRNPSAPSLASSASFQKVAAEAKGSLLFAYVDGPAAVKRFGSQIDGQQGRMIRALLDLEHLESIVVTLTTNDQGISLAAQMNLMPGHKNMIYALVRTAPMTKRSLELVPQGAAGVLTIGLNPPGPAAPTVTNPDGTPSISLMDVGRELFGNIDEVSVFAMAPAGDAQGRQPFPEIGAVIAVKDPAKSEALWNQILSLATLFGAKSAQPPTEAEIAGKKGSVYQFDGIPPIAVVRAGGVLVVGTRSAVTAAVQAGADGNSILKDPLFAPLLARLTPNASKALLIDAGRAMPIVAALAGGGSSDEMRLIGALVHDMKISIVTDEAPNRLTIRADVTGLPKFRDIVMLLNGQQRQAAAAK
ncbi:MAG: hypothetical protein WD063_05060 [Pirellulales bacterium]